MNIMFSAFIATSLDGYIARPNGKLDWLDSVADKSSTEDYGYQKFISRVSCIVMGRKTFEKVSAFAQWPYENKQVIVLSKSLLDVPEDFADKVSIFNGDLELLVVELQDKKVAKVYVDGGLTVQSFINSELLDEIIITQVPILIGKGISLFDNFKQDINLKLIKSQSYDNGFVQSHYKIENRSSRYFD